MTPRRTAPVAADAAPPGDPPTPAQAIEAMSGDPNFMTSLARGRIHIAALAVGSAQRALDEAEWLLDRYFKAFPASVPASAISGSISRCQ